MAIAVTLNNTFLALTAVISGMLILTLVRKKTKTVIVDERIQNISGQAARLTYAILTTFVGLISIFFILSGNQNNDAYVQSLGTILSYITLLSIGLYAVSYKYFNNKYGASDDK